MEVIEASGFHVKGVGRRPERGFHVRSLGAGKALLTAPAVPGHRRGLHRWRWSLDGKTWTELAPTLKGKKLLVGLNPGTRHLFQHLLVDKAKADVPEDIMKSGGEDWGAPQDIIAT